MARSQSPPCAPNGDAYLDFAGPVIDSTGLPINLVGTGVANIKTFGLGGA
jgi:hypothetical protein